MLPIENWPVKIGGATSQKEPVHAKNVHTISIFLFERAQPQREDGRRHAARLRI